MELWGWPPAAEGPWGSPPLPRPQFPLLRNGVMVRRTAMPAGKAPGPPSSAHFLRHRTLSRHLAPEDPAGASDPSPTSRTHGRPRTHMRAPSRTELQTPCPHVAQHASSQGCGFGDLFPSGVHVSGAAHPHSVPSRKASSCHHKTHSKWPAAQAWMGSSPWDLGS